MTGIPYSQPAQPAAKPPPVFVAPEPGTPLEQLMTMLEAAEAELAEARERAADLQEKAEAWGIHLATAANGGVIPGRIIIAGSAAWTGRNLTWHGGDRKFNREQFDTDHPGLYERYMTGRKKAYWEFRKQH